MGHWAFSWVQIIAHNKMPILLINSLLTLLALYGLLRLNSSFFTADFALISLGLILMAVLVGWFLESLKIALLQLFFSSLILLTTMALAGWLELVLDDNIILGLMVVITIVSSNLVHVLSTMSREMARGLFQFDAIAEAIKLNVAPIFLSNMTTAAGFVAASIIEPGFYTMAALVVIGVSLSFLMIMSWLPLLVLSWLLEFRVGNTADRKGLNKVVGFLQQHSKTRLALLGMVSLMAVLLFVLDGQQILSQSMLLALLGVFSLVFWFFWQNLTLAVTNSIAALLALSAAISITSGWFEWSSVGAMLWLVPLGIIIDDGIHFFSRYSRAKQTLFADKKSAVVFAMASVGRPIWITSWTLLLAMLLLLFSKSTVVFQAASLTLVAILLAALLILLVIPAFILSSRT